MHTGERSRWGLRLLALLFAVLGAWGVVRGLPDILGTSPQEMRRLAPNETVQALLHDFPGNFATVAVFSLFMVVLCIHFLAVLRDLYPHAPVAALAGGVFLGGSVLFGLALGLTALKINEFALQAARGAAQQQPWFTSEQQAWLHDGINFLNQLHLVSVWGWLLCLGLGFIFLGAGVLSARLPNRLIRLAGVVGFLAGLGVVSGIFFELWKPMYAGAPPRHALFFLHLWEVAVAGGFLASGSLGWLLTAEGPPAPKP